MMLGEASLAKDPNRSVASFIVDDVNDAHRRFALDRKSTRLNSSH